MELVWYIVQFLIGYNLVLPFLLFVFWYIGRQGRSVSVISESTPLSDHDYAVIVTAYEQVDSIPQVVNSILSSAYQNFIVYVVADKCDISGLHFFDERVVILRPPQTLASNTASHQYAVENFLRDHDFITIIDSDNLVHPDYFLELNRSFSAGFEAVQGIRHAKNLDTTVACLDAARDLYYHFYDGIVLSGLGSSATLSGSGMAFSVKLYRDFLARHKVRGAGFDKVLQHFIVSQGLRIAFNEKAIVYDEKTSKETQLVNQRARWINTWFKYFKLGFGLLGSGLLSLNLNKTLFGIILLRPPLFIFLILSMLCLFLNVLFLDVFALAWLLGLLLFVFGFYLALNFMGTDRRIYRSLSNIPNFIYLQIKSLLRSRNANKHSVATRHYHTDSSSNTKAL